MFYGQLAGYAAPDPLVQLELEMLIDNSTGAIETSPGGWSLLEREGLIS